MDGLPEALVCLVAGNGGARQFVAVFAFDYAKVAQIARQGCLIGLDARLLESLAQSCLTLDGLLFNQLENPPSTGIARVDLVG